MSEDPVKGTPEEGKSLTGELMSAFPRMEFTGVLK
jgi:hypothetical protein